MRKLVEGIGTKVSFKKDWKWWEDVLKPEQSHVEALVVIVDVQLVLRVVVVEKGRMGGGRTGGEHEYSRHES